MNAPLPPKKIMIPMHLNPASRYNIGGRPFCLHHYSDASKREFRDKVEWTCSNCDRVCGFYKFKEYDEQKEGK
jgi:hypothetical protein